MFERFENIKLKFWTEANISQITIVAAQSVSSVLLVSWKKHELFFITILVNVFTCRISLTTTRMIFSDKLEFLLMKYLIDCSIIIAHVSVDKPNIPLARGGKAIVKILLCFVISNACIIPFFRSSWFFNFLLWLLRGTKE